MKDAIAYFGFRQVFGGTTKGRATKNGSENA
jgi:hypothetical protein